MMRNGCRLLKEANNYRKQASNVKSLMSQRKIGAPKEYCEFAHQKILDLFLVA